jgi:hypothetical protein
MDATLVVTNEKKEGKSMISVMLRLLSDPMRRSRPIGDRLTAAFYLLLPFALLGFFVYYRYIV